MTTEGQAHPDDLLTAEEVARILRMTPAWVYAETRRHHIPHIRLGRFVRYRRGTLNDWMDGLEEAAEGSTPLAAHRTGDRVAAL